MYVYAYIYVYIYIHYFLLYMLRCQSNQQIAGQSSSYQNIVSLDKDSEIHLITHELSLITEFNLCDIL